MPQVKKVAGLLDSPKELNRKPFLAKFYALTVSHMDVNVTMTNNVLGFFSWHSDVCHYRDTRENRKKNLGPEQVTHTAGGSLFTFIEI